MKSKAVMLNYPITGKSILLPEKEISVPSRDGFLAEIEHFLDCLDSNTEPITSGREERKPLAAVLAVYESINSGERVYLTEGPK